MFFRKPAYLTKVFDPDHSRSKGSLPINVALHIWEVERTEGRKKAIRENLSSYAFLVPWLLGFFIFTSILDLFPVPLLNDFNIFASKWIGLRNYFVMFVETIIPQG